MQARSNRDGDNEYSPRLQCLQSRLLGLYLLSQALDDPLKLLDHRGGRRGRARSTDRGGRGAGAGSSAGTRPGERGREEALQRDRGDLSR